jgi:hypothetical protein
MDVRIGQGSFISTVTFDDSKNLIGGINANTKNDEPKTIVINAEDIAAGKTDDIVKALKDMMVQVIDGNNGDYLKFLTGFFSEITTIIPDQTKRDDFFKALGTTMMLEIPPQGRIILYNKITPAVIDLKKLIGDVFDPTLYGIDPTSTGTVDPTAGTTPKSGMPETFFQQDLFLEPKKPGADGLTFKAMESADILFKLGETFSLGLNLGVATLPPNALVTPGMWTGDNPSQAPIFLQDFSLRAGTKELDKTSGVTSEFFGLAGMLDLTPLNPFTLPAFHSKSFPSEPGLGAFYKTTLGDAITTIGLQATVPTTYTRQMDLINPALPTTPDELFGFGALAGIQKNWSLSVLYGNVLPLSKDTLLYFNAIGKAGTMEEGITKNPIIFTDNWISAALSFPVTTVDSQYFSFKTGLGVGYTGAWYPSTAPRLLDSFKYQGDLEIGYVFPGKETMIKPFVDTTLGGELTSYGEDANRYLKTINWGLRLGVEAGFGPLSKAGRYPITVRLAGGFDLGNIYRSEVDAGAITWDPVLGDWSFNTTPSYLTSDSHPFTPTFSLSFTISPEDLTGWLGKK